MLPSANDAPFLVNPANAPFLAGTGLAMPQRYGSGASELVIGAALGAASLLLLFVIGILRINLDAAAMVLIAAGLVGTAAFAATNVRSGWRAVQLARLYRRKARRVYGTFTALELVDEGSGDWFLKGSYQFADEVGGTHQGTFAQYRRDLAEKPLPPVGTPAVVLVVDSNQHTIL